VSDCCATCLRRSWLLEQLAVRLDHRRRDVARLWEILALDDRALIDAIGGRRRAQLHHAYEAFDAGSPSSADPTSVCRHSRRFPAGLAEQPLAPRCLHVHGDLAGLGAALGAAVAIVGSHRATDHGMSVARKLASDLALAGVTVASTLAAGIGAAALAGATVAGGRPVALLAEGTDRLSPASCAGVWRGVAAGGWLVSELPRGASPRAWSALAHGRTLALATSMMLVVELAEQAPELSWARLAADHGKALAAVPGRVGSAGASGPHLLIREGATLVRDAADVLDALHRVPAGAPSCAPRDVPLPAPLRATWEEVSNGADTLAKLLDGGAPHGRTVLALAELEALGLLTRGDGGRYVAGIGGVAR
jgi:DNA processing protein